MSADSAPCFMAVLDLSHQPTQAPKVGKSPNSSTYNQVRLREYLTKREVEGMMKAAKAVGRYGHRDSTLNPISLSTWTQN
jgi:hypothetical protein